MSRHRFDGLERFAFLFETPEPSPKGFLRRRVRKRSNQRIAAGVVGIAVFVAAWIAAAGGPFDRIQLPAARGPILRSQSDETRVHPWRGQEKRQRRQTSFKKVSAVAVAAEIGPAALTLGPLWDKALQDRPTSGQWPRGPPPRPTALNLRTGGRIPLAESHTGSSSYVVSLDGARLACTLHRASRVDV
jgi:hypothetical protein